MKQCYAYGLLGHLRVVRTIWRDVWGRLYKSSGDASVVPAINPASRIKLET